jgi:hypothetical protein
VLHRLQFLWSKKKLLSIATLQWKVTGSFFFLLAVFSPLRSHAPAAWPLPVLRHGRPSGPGGEGVPPCAMVVVGPSSEVAPAVPWLPARLRRRGRVPLRGRAMRGGKVASALLRTSHGATMEVTAGRA